VTEAEEPTLSFKTFLAGLDDRIFFPWTCDTTWMTKWRGDTRASMSSWRLRRAVERLKLVRARAVISGLEASRVRLGARLEVFRDLLHDTLIWLPWHLGNRVRRALEGEDPGP
jgi:hypothetical protein